jgi:hypothetical protein
VLLVVLALLSGPVVGALVNSHATYYAVLDSFCVALIALSYALYRSLRPRVAVLTGLAAVSILWGLLSLLTTTTSTECPVSTTLSGRCSVSEISTTVLLAMILPLLPYIYSVPLRFTRGGFRIGRGIYLTQRARARARNAKPSARSKSSPKN